MDASLSSALRCDVSDHNQLLLSNLCPDAAIDEYLQGVDQREMEAYRLHDTVNVRHLNGLSAATRVRDAAVAGGTGYVVTWVFGAPGFVYKAIKGVIALILCCGFHHGTIIFLSDIEKDVLKELIIRRMDRLGASVAGIKTEHTRVRTQRDAKHRTYMYNMEYSEKQKTLWGQFVNCIRWVQTGCQYRCSDDETKQLGREVTTLSRRVERLAIASQCLGTVAERQRLYVTKFNDLVKVKSRIG